MIDNASFDTDEDEAKYCDELVPDELMSTDDGGATNPDDMKSFTDAGRMDETSGAASEYEDTAAVLSLANDSLAALSLRLAEAETDATLAEATLAETLLLLNDLHPKYLIPIDIKYKRGFKISTEKEN